MEETYEKVITPLYTDLPQGIHFETKVYVVLEKEASLPLHELEDL